ncbi:olfactory receptor class A-like protein 1 [Macrotis lagotis]|uniref:olfactory receptor class A-like protein 1 n=1 Tax=Macrotis lagotis TaxID=92651 RepID=UPI003D681664
MQSYNEILCIFYLLQIIIGVFGNGLLLFLYGFNLITSQRTRHIDVIFINLALSHIVMILFRGVPLSIQVCIQKIFLSDIECKIIIYLQRMSRGLTICNNCLLSVFQAITISSSSPKGAELKAKAAKYIFPSCVLLWVLNFLIDVDVPLHVTGTRNNTIGKFKRNLGFCFIDLHALSTSVIWKTFYDAVFVGLMAITSGYMAFIFFRHHSQVQHLHNTSLNPTGSPEIRATKVILLLMIIFVSFYSVASIFVIVMETSKDSPQWVTHISVFFTASYSTISPFVLIINDSQILNCSRIFKRMQNFYLHSGRRRTFKS